MRETSANELLTTHRNRTQTTSKPECPACSESSMEGTYLLAMRCPVYRRRDSHPGLRTELENLVGNAKGRRPKRKPSKADSTDVPNRGGLLRSSDETG